MNRRLRKKKRVDGFKELGFQLLTDLHLRHEIRRRSR
jgi:uncharacterized protein YggL (DUF469 family)